MTFPADGGPISGVMNAPNMLPADSNSYRIPGSGAINSQLVSSPTSPRKQSIIAAQQVIRTTVIGPEMLVQDTPELFEIEVTNNSLQTATNIVIQMGVSEHLTITDFDRFAWLDENNRTVSWRLSALQSGYKDVIRFRAVSGTPGNHQQSITVGMDDTFQGKTGFIAHVVPGPVGENLQISVFDK